MRKLLIFDLDETLVHASERELGRAADILCPPYFIYKRPFINELLAKLSPRYDFAVWSSSSPEYVNFLVPALFGPFRIEFAWASDRCVQRVDVRSNGYVYIKDLRKVQKFGYALDQVTILDDSPEKIVRQPRNHILVSPFYGDEKDEKLLGIVNDLLRRAG
jgi:RNA polymerase II subunit A small phosphatase-like protein